MDNPKAAAKSLGQTKQKLKDSWDDDVDLDEDIKKLEKEQEGLKDG